MKCNLRNLVFALLVFSILLLVGCVSEEAPTAIVKELPQVKEFLAEHPNAKIAATKLTAEAVEQSINEIRENCGWAMKVQDYWYVAIFEGDEKLEVYIDTATNKPVCIVKGIGALEISQDLNGYIVQFENDPIIARKNRLEKEAKELANVPLNETQIAEKLKAYSEYLDRENKKVKEKILPESAEKIARIENEFKNVFNGIFLLATKEVAEEIKKIPGVKAVYPNLEVHATLMDSVPLIQAGVEAGRLDEDGADCTASGKPCLTGEGVTIAILDTGIDYTHPDLGGCFGGKNRQEIQDRDWCNIDETCNGVQLEIEQGEIKTINFGGNEYQIEVTMIAQDESDLAILIVNGETNFVVEGQELSINGNKFFVEEIGVEPHYWEPHVKLTIGENRIACPNDCENSINKVDDCKVIGGYDFTTCNYVSFFGYCLDTKIADFNPMDDHGHGTHCAGIAAGSGEGGLKGVAPDAKLYAYKVLNWQGSGSWEGILAALDRAIDPNQDGNFGDKVDIISMSLGGSGSPDDPLSQAVDNAVDAGVVVVVAAGNNGPRSYTIDSPGTARKAITVGATYKKDYSPFWFDCTPNSSTDCGTCPNEGKVQCSGFQDDEYPKKEQITYFSSRGPVLNYGEVIQKPDIVAPGAIICSARHDNIFEEGEHPYYRPCLDEGHVQMAGTSMATPMVAGATALIKQVHSNWTPEEIKQALKSTAIDLGEDTSAQGYGRIDVAKAVGLKNVPLITRINEIEVRDVVDINGTVKGEGFDYYEVLYAEELSNNWNFICRGNSQIEDGILCAAFNLRNLRNGAYYIFKLDAYDMDGQKTTFELPLHVSFPAECQDNDNECPSNCDPGNDTDCFTPGKTGLREGERLTGLRGTENYAGQNDLYIKLDGITFRDPYNTIHVAAFSLYDGQDNLIHSIVMDEGSDLSRFFIDSEAKYVLLDSLRLTKIGEGIKSGVNYVEIEITEREPEPICIDNDGECPSSCDPGNDNDCFTPGKETLREGEYLTGLRGTYNYIGLNNLQIELGAITQPTAGNYSAMFRAYYENNLIDSKTGSALTNLNEYFADGSGKRVLRDRVKVTKIGAGVKSGIGYVEIEIAPLEDTLWAEGETRSGFRGAGDYAGQNNLKIKVAGITQITSYYFAVFELYNEEGNLISSTDVRIEKAANLREYLLDQNGHYALQDNVLIKEVFFSPISGAYFEIEIREVENLTLTEGDEIRNLSGRGNYTGQNNLYIELRQIKMIGPTYEGEFALYNGEGKLINTVTQGIGTDLRNIFIEGEDYVLQDSVIIKSFRLDPRTSTGYFDIEVIRS